MTSKSAQILSYVLVALAAWLVACGNTETPRSTSDPASAASSEIARAEAKEASPRGDIPHAIKSCRDCREYFCSSYDTLELNLIKLCFDNPDPQFTAECIAAKNCAYERKCGYSPTSGAAECVCGSASTEECTSPGKADGSCKAEWLAAGRTDSLANLALNFGDLSLPVGIAYYLHACDRDHCPMCKQR